MHGQEARRCSALEVTRETALLRREWQWPGGAGHRSSGMRGQSHGDCSAFSQTGSVESETLKCTRPFSIQRKPLLFVSPPGLCILQGPHGGDTGAPCPAQGFSCLAPRAWWHTLQVPPGSFAHSVAGPAPSHLQALWRQGQLLAPAGIVWNGLCASGGWLGGACPSHPPP